MKAIKIQLERALSSPFASHYCPQIGGGNKCVADPLRKFNFSKEDGSHPDHVRQAQKGDGAVWSHTTCSPSVLTAAECDGRGTTEKGERGRINDSQIGKSRGV